MCLCFETMLCQDGVLQHLSYHQARVNRTRVDLFGLDDVLHLSDLQQELPKKGSYRVRVEYARSIEKLTCEHYESKKRESFLLVESDMSYAYKYSQRSEIDALMDKRYDDIIITNNGLLRDTSIANIALFIDNTWLTPKKPLLAGTTRSRLLQDGFLATADLRKEDLKKMKKFAIMNALVGFKIIENIRICF